MANPNRKSLCAKKTFSLISMLGLTGSFFLVEIVVGYITGSVALIADSFHMLSDVISLIVGFFALRYSKKTSQTDRNTFGWQRAEVLGALINAVFLVALCFTIFIEALKRLIEVEEITNPWLVLIVGGAGLFINVIGLFMFHGHGHSHGGQHHGHSHGVVSNGHSSLGVQSSETVLPNIGNVEESNVADLESTSQTNMFENSYLKDAREIQKFATVIVREKSREVINTNATDDTETHVLHTDHSVTTSAQMNMRAVYLHVLGDALGSVIVIASALCIIYGEGDWTLYVDPGMSLIMVFIILRSSVPLLKESALILMQTVPTHIKIHEIRERLLKQVDGVLSLHEFHVWQLAGDKIIASAHITCRSMAEYMPIANKVKDFFHNEGIHSTTIQPEFIEDPPELLELDNCVLDCGEDKDCGSQRCCPDDVRMRKKQPASEKDKDNGRKSKDVSETSAEVAV
ncbi:zinc transporter 1-like [Dendronephthya gigantea]|uniref:zinc transporter 1-like n=1 Tax=Dendronephthya gigantea TaxID=151771 RepID=UPI00106AAE71|nr:zinc transporter 1-like [Dendronephthya gigantea]XP_028407891.1 zinc transporter 1-like [Dendronephthya gigantea]XP_028407892.1 zinc transporter 1-like [Dendronephthya gigantea]